VYNDSNVNRSSCTSFARGASRPCNEADGNAVELVGWMDGLTDGWTTDGIKEAARNLKVGCGYDT